jgi:POT family proton-dependent oligopeptide transporter
MMMNNKMTAALTTGSGAAAARIEATTPEAASDTGFFGHPRGLSTLFFTELWERFSYYGMRAILILYMTATAATGGLGFNVDKAGAIYGIYTAMVYMVSLPGGWIADKLLGQRQSVFYGGIVIMLGHICLAIHSMASFYFGLFLIVVGTGLLKPNISVMVGQLYSENDQRRDAGFSIYYMGINIGAFLSPLVCGWLAQGEGFRAMLSSWGMNPNNAWHWGFAAAAVGMFFGLVQYVLGKRAMGEAGLHPSTSAAERPAMARKLRNAIIIIAAVLGTLLALSLTGVASITAQMLANAFGVVLTLTAVVFFMWLFMGAKWTPDERKRLIVILLLFFGAAIFWSAFEQAGSSMNLFAERSTANTLFGFNFPASWFQSLNALFIIALAPVAAWLWVSLGSRNPSSPAKFGFGLVFLGLGFVVLVVGAQLSANGVRVSPMWLAVTYLLHTIGELCLSPVGLSAMTKLAPARVAGMMMGVWFLGSSVGNFMAGTLARFYDKLPVPTIFSIVAATSIIAGLVFWMLVKPIRRMMQRAH